MGYFLVFFHWLKTKATMAQAVKKQVHAYKMSGSLNGGVMDLWLSDTVTKTRFQRQFKVEDFPEVGDINEVFGVIKKALEGQSWAATYPKNNGESIQIEIDNGVLKISLPPVAYQEEDAAF